MEELKKNVVMNKGVDKADEKSREDECGWEHLLFLL